MEALLLSALCLPANAQGPEYARACRPAFTAFVLETDLRPRLKAAERRALSRINKNYLGLYVIALASAKREVRHTWKFERSRLLAVTVAVGAEQSSVQFTLKEF